MRYFASSAIHDGAAEGVVNEPRRALVFDDHADIGSLTATQLVHCGFNSRYVIDRIAFIQAAKSWRPDLILLDLSLGPTDAIELLGWLKEQAFRGSVILMSGHSDALLNRAQRLGAGLGIKFLGVLKKPFHLRDLRALVAGPGVEQPRGNCSVKSEESNPALLREALDNNYLEFWYQPKIDLKTDRLVGAECLARIRHPARGILAPSAFLNQVSNADLNDLTMRALDDALCRAKAMSLQGRPLTFSINIAARTFVRTGLLDEIRAVRERYSTDLPIIFEMTETDLVDDTFAAEVFATRAILHGFRISIDDFGNGYATFQRLRDTPFTELKIERSMVDGCARDTALRSICKAAVQLAHGFGAKAIAEGVEREDDLEVIRSLGFDMAQGYLFSRPLPFPDFEKLPVVFRMRHYADKGATA